MTTETQATAQYIELTRKETADLIGLLAAQLAEEPLIGNQGGACPSVKVREMNQTKELLFIVKSSEHPAEEILQDGQVVALSRRQTANIISILSEQLVTTSAFARTGYCGLTLQSYAQDTTIL